MGVSPAFPDTGNGAATQRPSSPWWIALALMLGGAGGLIIASAAPRRPGSRRR